MRLEPLAPLFPSHPTGLNAPTIDIWAAQMYIYEGSLWVILPQTQDSHIGKQSQGTSSHLSEFEVNTDVVELKFPNPSLTHCISGCVFEAPSHMV